MTDQTNNSSDTQAPAESPTPEPVNIPAEHKFNWLNVALENNDLPTLRVMARKGLTMYDVKELTSMWYKAARELDIDPNKHLPTVRFVLTQEGLAKELQTFSQAVQAARAESASDVQSMECALLASILAEPPPQNDDATSGDQAGENLSEDDKIKRVAYIRGQRDTLTIINKIPGALPLAVDLMPVIQFGHMATNMMIEHGGWQLPVTALWLHEQTKEPKPFDMATALFVMSYSVLSSKRGLADLASCAFEMGLTDIADRAELAAMINVEVKTIRRFHEIYEVELLRGLFMAFPHAITETCDTLPWYLQGVGRWIYRLLPTLVWARDNARGSLLAAAIKDGRVEIAPPRDTLSTPPAPTERFPKHTTTDEDRKRRRLAPGEELC